MRPTAPTAPAEPPMVPTFVAPDQNDAPGGPPSPPSHAADGGGHHWHLWWETGTSPSVPERQGPQIRYVPPEHKLTTLGWLKHMGDPTWQWWEHYYLLFLQKNLTYNWKDLMYGVDQHATKLWWEIFQVLELDKKSQLDLLSLAQSGPVGRAYANEILWALMANWGLQREYRDLSNKVSNDVNRARKKFCRPPAGHQDLQWWTWASYRYLPRRMKCWSPLATPPEPWDLLTGPGGIPLPPPACWQQRHD